MKSDKIEITIYFHFDSVGLRAMHIKPFCRSYEEGKRVAGVYKVGSKTDFPHTNCRGYIVKRYI